MPTRTADVLRLLTENKILLKQDKRLPNVVTIVTGESLSTSWWSHPKGRLIFRILAELADHPDVLFTKLLFGKDTLVHRLLWPDLVAVAIARERWQLGQLSAPARALLASTKRGIVVPASGAPVKELVARLLVHAIEVHTESGKHEFAVESWKTWVDRVKVTPSKSVARARHIIEDACLKIGAPLSALPWARSNT